MKIFNYICHNVKNEYIGDCLNEKIITNLFRITDLNGRNHVMAVVLSKDHYQLNGTFKDLRLFSFLPIITVFFDTEKKVRNFWNFCSLDQTEI